MAMESNTQVSSDALSEGRRIYLGNLLYTVEAQEIEEGLRANGFEDFEAVQISVDPISGRNPGYCFVDFVNREAAERALESLDATIGGRTLKVGPCKPKQNRTTGRWGSDNRSSSYQRWGDEGSSPRSGGNSYTQRNQSSYDEPASEDTGKRVYVGGLGPSVEQALDSAEVTEIFTGFNPVSISNRIRPHESTSALPGNHHYCFVEFATREEAQSAIDTLNGKNTESGPLKVSMAKPPPNKQRDQRSSPYNNRFGDRPRRQDGAQGEASPAGARSMASGNWRRKGD